MIDFISGLFVQFQNQLQNNQFLTGLILSGVIGAGAYLCKSVPRKIGKPLFRLATIEATFRSDDAGFHMANEYVLRHVLIERLSRVFLLVFSAYSAEDSGPDRQGVKLRDGHRNFQPGYGRHFGWYKGRPVIVHREREKDSQSSAFKETVSVTFFTKNRAILNDFVASTRVYIGEVSESGTRIYVSADDWWSEHTKACRRSLDSIFLPKETKQRIIGHLDEFLASEEIYLRRGIPFHTGIFLYGPPGTGKSSIIHAIASHYRRSIRYLNLSAVSGDAQLMSLIGADWSNSILVIEDIDTAHVDGLATEDDGKVYPVPRRRRLAPAPARSGGPHGTSLSSLLNSLDGLLTPHGLIVIATANRPDLLPSALLRQGRFDIQAELGLMRWEEFCAMALAFDRNPDEFLLSYKPMVPVEARNMLLEAGNVDPTPMLIEHDKNVGRHLHSVRETASSGA